MTIIIDASSLILLSRASVLELFVSRNDIIMPIVVYNEVVKGKEKGREDSMLVEKLVQENKLKLKTPRKSTKVKIQKLFNIKAGELEVISLAYKTKHNVLSDDKKCLNVAKILGISFMISLDVIMAMHKKNIISKGKVLLCIDKLEEYGWYSKDLIKHYREM